MFWHWLGLVGCGLCGCAGARAEQQAAWLDLDAITGDTLAAMPYTRQVATGTPALLLDIGLLRCNEAVVVYV
jgi:hypothetical protein